MKDCLNIILQLRPQYVKEHEHCMLVGMFVFLGSNIFKQNVNEDFQPFVAPAAQLVLLLFYFAKIGDLLPRPLSKKQIPQQREGRACVREWE